MISNSSVKLSPPFQSFNMQPGQKAIAEFTITNNQPEPISISLENADLPEWVTAPTQTQTIAPGQASNFSLDIELPTETTPQAFVIEVPIRIGEQTETSSDVSFVQQLAFQIELNVFEELRDDMMELTTQKLPSVVWSFQTPPGVSTELKNTSLQNIRPLVYTQFVQGNKVLSREVHNSQLQHLSTQDYIDIETSFPTGIPGAHSGIITYEVLAVDRQFNQSTLTKANFIYLNIVEIIIAILVIILAGLIIKKVRQKFV